MGHFSITNFEIPILLLFTSETLAPAGGQGLVTAYFQFK